MTGSRPDVLEKLPSNVLEMLPSSVFEELAKRVLESMEPFMEAMQRIWENLSEELTKVQELKKQRKPAYPLTGSIDHTTAHVTHTSTKPPRLTRVYRRRTP